MTAREGIATKFVSFGGCEGGRGTCGNGATGHLTDERDRSMGLYCERCAKLKIEAAKRRALNND